ncbi:MAG: DUF2236 domain-containing protein [Saccharospirillaceae bacterium]|nr:DUF2236 domain-containing protein [Saccharospirillaceae bacterium]MCD8531265.1 DUF2236 domain-containing protein [Saccharospirillaceae bacterium]
MSEQPQPQHPPRFVYRAGQGRRRSKKIAWGLRFLLGVKPAPAAALTDAVASSYQRSDEQGDAVAAELFANPELRRAGINPQQLLRQAIQEGSRSLDERTPALKALLQEAETTPPWLDNDQLLHACRVIHRCGRFAMYALGDFALLGGYANSDISKPLAFTGALSGNSSFDRVSETTSFWFDVTTPGGLERGAAGYSAAVHVRVMHALVRRRLLQHPDWNSAEWGLPINQGDALATNVAFSMMMITGLSMLGWRFNHRDTEAVLHLWRYVAYLMGDDITLLPQTRQQGVDWLYIIATGSRINPDADSRQLAAAYLDSFRQVPGNSVYQSFVYWFHRSYATFFIPADIRRALNLPRTPVLGWLPALQFPLLRLADTAARLSPRFDRWLQRRGRKAQAYIVNSRLQGRQVNFTDKETLTR